MRREASVLTLLGALLICMDGAAQSVSAPEPAFDSNLLFNSAVPAPAPLKGQLSSPFLFVSNSVAQTNLYGPLAPKLILPPHVLLFDSPTTVSNALPPGLYKTEPYTCLVLVPGPHQDDKCIIGNGTTQPTIQMPIRRPELQFIPRRPAQ